LKLDRVLQIYVALTATPPTDDPVGALSKAVEEVLTALRRWI